VSGLNNPETTLRGWHKKDKNVFSRFVWGARRTCEGAGRNNHGYFEERICQD